MRAPARWPGPDGAIALLASTAVVLAAIFGPDQGVAGPAMVAVAGTLAWLVATRPDRPALPAGPAEIRPLVVIPTHGNAGTVGDVVARSRAILPDVLVVDDGSPDDSAMAAAAAGATVVRHPENRGKGAALETALRWAATHGFSHVVAIDADGQHHPEDLPAFLDALRAEPGAIQAGVRDMSEAPRGAVYARMNSNFWVAV